MDRDYLPEAPLFAVHAEGCEHDAFRRRRGILPTSHPHLWMVSRYESSVVVDVNGHKVDAEPRERRVKPYLESPI